MKKFIIENKTLIILWILCGIALFVFCGHYSNILLDIGKELYYPEKILDGKLLYRDLLNINSPFSYLFNALLYKIFTPNIATLYLSGIICSYAIVSGIYLLSKRFLSDFLSFSIGVFTIVTGICAVHLFNYTLPYNFGMLYGIVGAIYSLFALIKFKEENKTQYLYLTTLLAGLCVSCKPEFLLYGLFILIIAFLTKNKKIILNCLTCFMFVPVICASILVLQGLNINDIISSHNILKEFISTRSIENLYRAQGILFSPKIFLIWGKNILITAICILGLIGGIKFKEKNKYVGWMITLGISILLYFLTSPLIISYLVPLMLLVALIFYKKILENSALIYFIIGALTLSIKSFFILIPQNYGNYIIPIIICAFLALLFKISDKKYEKVFAIFLLVCSLSFLSNSIIARKYITGKISSDKGIIYTYPDNSKSMQQLIDKLKENNVKSAVIYPEGLIINFLTGINTENYYYSMTPAYVETFGEQTFIDRLRELKPEYIILNNLNMKEFGAGEICDDYAYLFRDFLFEEYLNTDIINNGFQYVLFKPKK